MAYQLEVAESIEEAFGGQEPAKNAPNTAPSQQVLKEWAEIFEKVWQQHNDAKLLSNKENLSDFERQVCQEISQNISIAQWSDQKRTAFVRAAVDAFLHNDLYRATQLFVSRAQGSFGLVTVSTLSPENLVLSAQGQPMTIGFNLPEEYTLYASEAAAVNAVLADLPESYRLDLDQTTGEIALVGANNIAVYSMRAGRELLESELEKRWMPVQGNSHIQRPQAETEDPVASDIQDIPQVLGAIATSWKDPASFNYQSAEYLADILIEKVKAFEKKRQKMFKAGLIGELGELQTVDFLILGIENSLWLGERFAQDLKIVFPLLNIKALSANQVLSQLQHDAQSLPLGKDSIVLAISQSGQTFPTLQATNAFENLYQNGAIGHNREIEDKGFDEAIVLESKTNSLSATKLPADQQVAIEELRESRFSSFERLLASYVVFWALAKKVASFPFLRYQHWKSQSRTRIATTAAPVSGISFDLTDAKTTPPTETASTATSRQPHPLPVAPKIQKMVNAPTPSNVPSIGTLNQPALGRSPSNPNEFVYPVPVLDAGGVDKSNQPAFGRSYNPNEFVYPVHNWYGASL